MSLFTKTSRNKNVRAKSSSEGERCAALRDTMRRVREAEEMVWFFMVEKST